MILSAHVEIMNNYWLIWEILRNDNILMISEESILVTRVIESHRDKILIITQLIWSYFMLSPKKTIHSNNLRVHPKYRLTHASFFLHSPDFQRKKPPENRILGETAVASANENAACSWRSPHACDGSGVVWTQVLLVTQRRRMRDSCATWKSVEYQTAAACFSFSVSPVGSASQTELSRPLSHFTQVLFSVYSSL